MSLIQHFRKIGESWEEYCQRKTLESQDKIRLYRGMVVVIPLLRAVPEFKDIDLVLSAMALSNYDDARRELILWLHEHCGADSVAPILSAFDTYSV